MERVQPGRHGLGQRAARGCALLGIGAVLLCVTAIPAAAQSLSVPDVNRIIAQAVQEADSRAMPATIAVVDRVGNVLGVYQMPGAPATVTVTSGRTVRTGIDGLAGVVPSAMASISKAVTGAYLSSSGNAFSTRTASQIIQQHFNPGEDFAPGGPLFGVQFSQLPCSDLSRRFTSVVGPDQFRGPKRAPLGLSADPGGLPLYIGGTVVGGIGVIADGVYGLDLNVVDFDSDIDEIIALAGATGFGAPRNIVADRITLEGKSLRFADADASALQTNPATAPAPAPGFVAVAGYSAGAPIAGQTYGASASGVRAIDVAIDGAAYTNVANISGGAPHLLVTGADLPFFPIIAGAPSGGQNLTVAEVSAILGHALRVANTSRAQIRRPLQSPVQVTVSIVDQEGVVLGQARTPDAPVFGIDVSLQKARSSALLSNVNADANLSNPAVFPTAQATATILNGLIPGHAYAVPDYVAQTKAFIQPSALSNGGALSDRAIGNLARPYYPDGVQTSANGPLSRPFASWSPFSTGLQLDLSVTNILEHILFVSGASVVDTGLGCTPVVSNVSALNPLANGLQIFAGAVPIYKNGVLVGAIGVSGDGIDQDDMVAFLGLHNASIALASGVSNAPSAIRADQLQPAGIRLRYAACPFAPFLGSRQQNACKGI